MLFLVALNFPSTVFIAVVWLMRFVEAVSITQALHSNSLRSTEDIDDTTILQFMVLLEHVENAFYHTFMDKFDEAAFQAAGFPPWVRGRYVQIVEHEDVHLRFLEALLGEDAPARCTYQFPVETVHDFVALSGTLEDGATAAYLGYSDKVESKELVTQTGSIVITETRHAAWIDAAVNKGSAWSGSFATPLDMDSIFTLLSSFTVSCPTSNPVVPFVVRTPLAFSPAFPAPGETTVIVFNVSATGVDPKSSLFLTLFSGLNTTFVPLESNGGNFTATIPTGLQGAVFAVVTNDTNVPIPHNATLTGPSVLQFPFNSQAHNAQ